MPSLTATATPSGRPSGRNGGVLSASSRKSANRYFSEETMPSSDTRITSGRLQLGKLRRLLRQAPLQRIQVLEQPRTGELQEVEAEGRVLHVKLLDLGIADAENHAGLDALQRLGPRIRR